MTRKISFVTGVVGAALAFAVPAFGKGQPVEQPQWQKAMEARSTALNRQYQLGDFAKNNTFQYPQPETAVPQWKQALTLRSEGLNRIYHLGDYASPSTTQMLDARERALVRQGHDPFAAINARERAMDTKAVPQPAPGPREPVVDDRFRIDPSSTPASVTVATDGDGIEWPQVGIGFGVGIVLALGLLLALRAARIRPLAH